MKKIIILLAVLISTGAFAKPKTDPKLWQKCNTQQNVCTANLSYDDVIGTQICQNEFKACLSNKRVSQLKRDLHAIDLKYKKIKERREERIQQWRDKRNEEARCERLTRLYDIQMELASKIDTEAKRSSHMRLIQERFDKSGCH